jgi:uncharacterized protein DUF6884
MEQDDFFLTPRFEPLSSLLGSGGKPATIIVGCGRSKLDRPATARQLYVSERFQLACATAETLGGRYYVLSGLHGVVSPDAVLSPYDIDLAASDRNYQVAWRKKALDALTELQSVNQVCLLVTKAYADVLFATPTPRNSLSSLVAPLTSIEDHLHMEWHKQALVAAKRYRDLKRLYDVISNARQMRRTFLLRDLSKQRLPTRGVYLFLDPIESNFNQVSGRIVRIGTHAVSIGSKATLRSRLRNHLGLGDGSGNHRGSIFRLHVGRALLERDGLAERLPSWGRGQDAPPDVRGVERNHEIRVSDYLRALEVFIIEIDDLPSKNSLRAAVERQLIALCSEAMQPIDRASANWLGRYSPMPAIAQSGLWNLRDVGRKYEPDGIGSVEQICGRGLQ